MIDTSQYGPVRPTCDSMWEVTPIAHQIVMLRLDLVTALCAGGMTAEDASKLLALYGNGERRTGFDAGFDAGYQAGR